MTTSSRMTYAFARCVLQLQMTRVLLTWSGTVDFHFRIYSQRFIPHSSSHSTPYISTLCLLWYLDASSLGLAGNESMSSNNHPLTRSSAFNAIISASVVALGVSYGIPIAINCIRGRRMLPDSRPFKLSGLVGWIANLVCLSYDGSSISTDKNI